MNDSSINMQFIDVCELHLLENKTDGAEMYSMKSFHADTNLYISSIKHSAKHLLQQSLHQFTQ